MNIKSQELPCEIIEKIANFLNIKDAIKLCKVCQKFRGCIIVFEKLCRLGLQGLSLRSFRNFRFRNLEINFDSVTEKTFNVYKKFMKTQKALKSLRVSGIKNTYITSLLETIQDKKIDELAMVVTSQQLAKSEQKSIIVNDPMFINFQGLRVKVLNLELMYYPKLLTLTLHWKKPKNINIINHLTKTVLQLKGNPSSIEYFPKSPSGTVFECFKFLNITNGAVELTLVENYHSLLVFHNDCTDFPIFIESLTVNNAKSLVIESKNIKFKKILFSSIHKDICTISLFSGKMIEIEDLILDILSKDPIVIMQTKNITINRVFVKTSCVSSNVSLWLSPSKDNPTKSANVMINEIMSNKPVSVVRI